MVLKKTLESPLDCKEIQPVHSKGTDPPQHKTAYEMCVGDWSSDVCSSDLEELMLLNCGVGEDSLESLGLQGDPTSPF